MNTETREGADTCHSALWSKTHSPLNKDSLVFHMQRQEYSDEGVRLGNQVIASYARVTCPEIIRDG